MTAVLQPLKVWWDGREPRERVLLGVLAALVVALIYVYGLLLPLQRLADAQADRHRLAAAALTEARSLQTAIAAREGGRAGPVSEDVLRRSAAEAGITLGAVEAQAGGTVEVSIEAVAAKPLFLWLDRLQQTEGAGVRAFEAHRADDGLVQARLVLAGRGR